MYSGVQVGRSRLGSASSTASTSSASLTSPVPGSGAVHTIASAAAPAARLQSLEAVVGAPAPCRSPGNPAAVRDYIAARM